MYVLLHFHSYVVDVLRRAPNTNVICRSRLVFGFGGASAECCVTAWRRRRCGLVYRPQPAASK
jgi:hypothetical protein